MLSSIAQIYMEVWSNMVQGERITTVRQPLPRLPDRILHAVRPGGLENSCLDTARACKTGLLETNFPLKSNYLYLRGLGAIQLHY